MLRNNFRTKLLGILAVPVVALVGVTAFAGYERLDEARDANQLRHRIDVIAAGTAVSHEVQLEEALSADAVANPSGSRTALAAQRASTDRAVQAYHDTVANAGDVSSPEFDVATDRVRRDLNALATTYRGSVDLGTDISSVVAAYGEIEGSISDLVSTVSDEAHDATLSRETAALAALSRAKDATAKEWSVLDVSLSRGSFAGSEQSLFTTAVADTNRWLGVHDGLATPESRTDLQTRMAGPAIATSDRIEQDALAASPLSPVTADPAQPAAAGVAQWNAAMPTRLGDMRQVLTDDINRLAAHASTVSAAATKDLHTFLLVALGAVLASSLLALIMARAVTTPLRQLTGAAEKLADEQLPALVDGLRNPSGQDAATLATSITPIEVQGNDEIGQLAQAFNTVQAVAVDVAAEQASTLRKGISEIFVNLARRNQVLIDRQIEFLDELEATEDDPDQLAQLYRLDHLATRMRRNAESLLVLAGVEPARTRTRPVPLFDVVRAAIGEVEDFSRIDLVAFDDTDVLGNSAVDLGHLLAELMDNAAHFSPPDTRVVIEGRNGHAGYVISITDSGIGMNGEQLTDANELLASPPPVGLALSRSLGFTVVARLAARYGVTVQLRGGERPGTGAIVHLPLSLIVSPAAADASEPATAAGEPVDASEAVDTGPRPSTAAHPIDDERVAAAAAPAVGQALDPASDAFETVIRATWGEDEPVRTGHVPVEGQPEPEPQGPPSLREALPQGRSFEKGLEALVDGDGVLGPAQLIEPPIEAPAAPPAAADPAPLARHDTAAPEGEPPEVVDVADVDTDVEVDVDADVDGADVADADVDTDVDDADVDTDVDVDVDAESQVTAAGLTRRVRKTSNEFEGVERFHAAPSGQSVLATKRSPDDVRAMLARYRTGLQRGRVGDDPITNEPGSEG